MKTKTPQRPRILYLTSHYPCPANYGAAQRAYHMCRLLGRLGELVPVVLLRSQFHDPARLAASLAEFPSLLTFAADRAPPRSLRGKISRHWQTSDIANRGHSLAIEDRHEFQRLVETSDLVWAHTLAAADMTGIYDLGPSVIDLDDLNSVKHSSNAKRSAWPHNLTSHWKARLWKKWELDALKRFSATVVCSEQDKQKLNAEDNVFVLPNGCADLSTRAGFRKECDKVLGFVGILTYPPNAEAIRWFVTHVLPILLVAEPTLRLRVAGKLPQDGLLDLAHANVDLLGFVSDLEAEFGGWGASIVPLKTGGGTRLKILEAFGKRLPVVSTALGVYGITAEHDRHLLIADTAEAFATCCLRLLEDRNAAEAMTQNAHDLVEDKYTWEKIGSQLPEILQRVLEPPAPSPYGSDRLVQVH